MENTLPAEAAGQLSAFVDDLRDRMGDNLVSVTLYGSAARGDWVAGRSDINVLILARQFPPAALKAAGLAARHWHTHLPLAPVFATTDYLATSADVFPLEFLDMRDAHAVLLGPDPFETLVVDDRNLRRQVESELKGKLMRLRSAYARSVGHPLAVENLIAESLSSFRALFQGLLRLRGAAVPGAAGDVMRRVAEAYGLDAAALQAAVDVRAGEPAGDAETIFAGYLDAVERLVAAVDTWEPA